MILTNLFCIEIPQERMKSKRVIPARVSFPILLFSSSMDANTGVAPMFIGVLNMKMRVEPLELCCGCAQSNKAKSKKLKLLLDIEVKHRSKLTPLCHSMRTVKSRTNHDSLAHVFPRFSLACICFEVHWNISLFIRKPLYHNKTKYLRGGDRGFTNNYSLRDVAASAGAH